MMDDFFEAILKGSLPKSTLLDGIWASQVAIKAFESVGQAGEVALV
jgi:hypothetical protein